MVLDDEPLTSMPSPERCSFLNKWLFWQSLVSLWPWPLTLWLQMISSPLSPTSPML